MALESNHADKISKGLTLEDKTLLLMKFIQNEDVLRLLYETMMNIQTV